MRNKRQALIQEITQNNKKLAETRANQRSTIQEISLLDKQVTARTELLATLKAELGETGANIQQTTSSVEALQRDLDKLSAEYAQLMRAAYRNHLQRGWLHFLLSSSNFNEVYRRWLYYRQYQRYRARQVRLVAATKSNLDERITVLQAQLKEKQLLLDQTTQQQSALETEKQTKTRLLSTLKGSEQQLLSTIQSQEKARETLSAAIEQAISREIALARQREREAAATPAPPASTNTTSSGSRPAASAPATTASSAGIRRGNLPWPVSGATIARPYGRQPHPTVKGVEITNNGIDLAVSGTQSVKSVADGSVVSIHFVQGYQNLVLLKHGDYYSVYSNLSNVSVSSGDTISAGQTIGQVREADGHLHFEFWRQKERLNPEQWIRK